MGIFDEPPHEEERAGGEGVDCGIAADGEAETQDAHASTPPESALPAAAPAEAPATGWNGRLTKAAVVACVVVGLLTFGAVALTRSHQPAATKEALLSNRGPGGGRYGPGGPLGRGRMGRPGGMTELHTAASAIGISDADLLTELRSGKSIADVAKAHNADVQKVIDAIVQDERSRLADAVKAGYLTQAQADQISSMLTDRVTQRVNGTGFGPPGLRSGPGPGGYGPGFGPGFGPGGGPGGGGPPAGPAGPGGSSSNT